MSATIQPFRFIYGVVDCPPRLPDGFRLIESPKDFLQAEDINGHRYFVSDTKLVRRGEYFDKDTGETECFVDTRTTIQL